MERQEISEKKLLYPQPSPYRSVSNGGGNVKTSADYSTLHNFLAILMMAVGTAYCNFFYMDGYTAFLELQSKYTFLLGDIFPHTCLAMLLHLALPGAVLTAVQIQ